MGSDAEKLVVGFSYSMAATLLYAVFSYIAGLLVMRLLGPEQYGLYQLVLMVPSLLFPILTVGIEFTMVRFIPKYLVTDAKRAIDTARYLFFVRLSISLVASLAMFVLSPWISKGLGVPVTTGLMIASLFLFANMLYVFIQTLFQAYFLMRERAVVITLFGASYLAAVLLLIFLGLGYIAPIAAMTISAVLAVLVGLVFAWKRNLSILARPSRQMQGLREQVRFAVPAYTVGLLDTLFPWVGVILIRISGLDVVFVGYFRGVYGIISLGLMIAFTLNVVIMPYLSELESKQNRDAMSFFCTSITRMLILLCLPMAAGFLILSGPVLGILLPDYIEATSLMQILSLLLLFMPMFMVSNAILTAIGKPRLVVYAGAITCVLTFLTGRAFGMVLGIEGIALGYVFSIFVGVCYSLAMMRKNTGASFAIGSAAKSVAATAIMGILVWFIMGNISSLLLGLTCAVLAGLGCYSGLIFLFGAVHEEDIQILRTAMAIAKSRARPSAPHKGNH